MNLPIERELKLALPDESTYQTLAGVLPNFRSEDRQENYYFETNEFHLLRTASVLRLRTTQSGAVVTFKSARKIEGGYFEANELEAPVVVEHDPEVEGFSIQGMLPPTVRSAISEIVDPSALVLLGGITNIRRKYEVRPGFVIELDRSIYGTSDQDFELEIELSDPQEAIRFLQPLFQRHRIAWRFQTLTKYQRFLSRRYPQAVNYFSNVKTS